MLKYTTVIFDLDGTILNTIEDLTDGINHALSLHGYPTHSIDAVCSFVGNGIGKLVERAVPHGTDTDATDKVLQSFCEYYSHHSADKTRPYDGITDMLKEVRSMGGKTAVVSNKGHFAVVPLCDRYFEGLIDVAVGEREGIRRKPCPDSVLEVMKTLGSDPKSTLYVGDSDVDIQTARNAGIDCVSVDWGFRSAQFLKDSGASVIVSNIDELLKEIVG